MSVNVKKRDGTCVVAVTDVFRPEDVSTIDGVAGSLPADEHLLVDFRDAREKILMAVWRLAVMAGRDPGRYRIVGLTETDVRFLEMMAGHVGAPARPAARYESADVEPDQPAE